MLIKRRKKGLFCLLWGTKVNKSLGYIQSSSLFRWQEQYRKKTVLFLRANFPYTATLLLAEILEICSSEGQSLPVTQPSSGKVGGHDCVYAYQKWKESSLLEPIAIQLKRLIHQTSVSLLFSVLHFHHTVTVFSVHMG